MKQGTRLRLKSTNAKINELVSTRYRDSEEPELTNSFFYHWLEADLDLADKADNLIKQLKDTIKRSYSNAKTREINPTRLGARPKEPGNKSNAYPTVPTTLEEEVAPTPDRTQDRVQESKFEDSRKEDLQRDYVEHRAPKTVVTDEASGQPTDNSQTMRL